MSVVNAAKRNAKAAMPGPPDAWLSLSIHAATKKPTMNINQKKALATVSMAKLCHNAALAAMTLKPQPIH